MNNVEKLVEKFNQWADKRIEENYDIPFFSTEQRNTQLDQIDTLNWAKKNLERLVKEVLAK